MFNDLAYATRSARNVLDIYLPDNAANPPLVVYIHGGAFFMGDKTGEDGKGPLGLSTFLAAGFAVALALLHKSADGRGPPFPGQTYATVSVMGMPSAVKPFRTATRI